MKKSIPALISFAVLLLFVSCNQNLEIKAQEDHFETLLLPGTGHFRATGIGDSFEEVKSREKAEIQEEGFNYLHYRITLGPNEYVNIAYHFDQSGLYEIILDATLEDKDKSHRLFKQFLDYYSRRFGKASRDEDYYIWKTNSEVSKNIEFALINKVTDSENGYFSLIISNYDY